MKRLWLILLLCMGMMNSSSAQQFFNKRDPLNSFFSHIVSVKELNGKYYCSSWSWDSSNYIGNSLAYNVYGIRLTVYDKSGNRINTYNFQKNDRHISPGRGKLIVGSDNTIIVAADEADTTGNLYFSVTQFDTLGQALFHQTYPNPFCNNGPYKFLRLADLQRDQSGNYLVLYRIACTTPAGALDMAVVLTKLDPSFNVLWHKKYGFSSMDEAGWRVLVEPDGYLIAGGRDNLNQVNQNFSLRATLQKVDTNGVAVWEWQSNSAKKTFEASDVIRTRDGGYVYCGQGNGREEPWANGSGTFVVFNAWVEKLDSNRNTVWSRSFASKYTEDEFRKIIEAPNGNIYLFGKKYLPDSIPTWELHTKGWMVMLSPNGDSLMERTYSGVHSCVDQNNFYDAQQTSDGGFVMVGVSTDQCNGFVPPNQRGWIVKVDSNGCLGPGDPQCWPTSIPNMPASHNISVYPNPVKDYWHIRNPEAGKLTITLSDLAGRVLSSLQSSERSIRSDVSSYAPGIYLYRITDCKVTVLQGKFVKQ